MLHCALRLCVCHHNVILAEFCKVGIISPHLCSIHDGAPEVRWPLRALVLGGNGQALVQQPSSVIVWLCPKKGITSAGKLRETLWNLS